MTHFIRTYWNGGQSPVHAFDSFVGAKKIADEAIRNGARHVVIWTGAQDRRDSVVYEVYAKAPALAA